MSGIGLFLVSGSSRTNKAEENDVPANKISGSDGKKFFFNNLKKFRSLKTCKIFQILTERGSSGAIIFPQPANTIHMLNILCRRFVGNNSIA